MWWHHFFWTNYYHKTDHSSLEYDVISRLDKGSSINDVIGRFSNCKLGIQLYFGLSPPWQETTFNFDEFTRRTLSHEWFNLNMVEKAVLQLIYIYLKKDRFYFKWIISVCNFSLKKSPEHIFLQSTPSQIISDQ